jgi:flagellar FliL protein
MLIIIIAAVVVLALGGAGAFIFISKQRGANAEEEEPVKAVQRDPKAPPVYLPLDSMVVNLADEGGDRVVQVGIILEVTDAKALDTVKSFLPTIRSGILLQLSQRTAEQLLTPEGKQKFSEAVLRAASVPFGGSIEEEVEEEETSKKSKKKRVREPDYPVIDVHFSSFIIQ